jgi:hypothetical protein
MLSALSGFEFTKTNRCRIYSNERSSMRTSKALTILVANILLVMTISSPTTHANPALPNPVLYLTGTESFSSGGKDFIRYRYDVLNKGDYPAELFAAAPALPPCGLNTKSSRTWVDIYDQRGKRLYGFCALGKPEALGSIWFALEEDVIPPSWIYIEMNHRQTNTKYKSNLAETTL